MGLLDMLAPDGDHGGLIDFLKRNAMASVAGQSTGAPGDMAGYDAPPAQAVPSLIQAAQAAPIIPGKNDYTEANEMQARWPYGPVGAPSATPAMASAPAAVNAPGVAPAAAASPIFAPAAQPAVPSAGPQMNQFGQAQGGMLSTGLQNIARVIGNLPRGGQDAPDVIAARTAAAQQNQTAAALIKRGVDPSLAQAAVLPGNQELLKNLLDQSFNGGRYTQETDKDGNVWNVDTKTGQKTVALQSKEDAFQSAPFENSDGTKVTRLYNKKTGEWVGGAPSDSKSVGLGDTTKTGQEYLATLDKPTQDTVKGMLDGTIQPPTSFAASKPYWQARIAAAKAIDPDWDENMWAERRKMRTSIAGSGNSDMGGIISNGKSSFQHLAELSDSFAGLGNASSEIPGFSYLQNSYKNKLRAGDKIKGALGATRDNLMHYGQESTKFYSGTGGGVEEREHALKEVDPATTSGEQQAAYVEKEKNLMLARLREKEAQIRNTMGSSYLAKHPVFDESLQNHIAEIDRNIARLRGQDPEKAAAKGDSQKATAGKDGTYNVGGSSYTVQKVN